MIGNALRRAEIRNGNTGGDRMLRSGWREATFAPPKSMEMPVSWQMLQCHMDVKRLTSSGQTLPNVDKQKWLFTTVPIILNGWIHRACDMETRTP
jgi:hypothetical protein